MPGRQGLAALRRYLIQVGVEGTGLGLGIATGGGRLSRPQLGAQGVGYACVRDEPVRQLAQTVVADWEQPPIQQTGCHQLKHLEATLPIPQPVTLDPLSEEPGVRDEEVA